MKNKRTNIFLGLVFLLIGVFSLLGSLNIVSFNIFFPGWWTLFIIVPSIICMLEEKINFANVFSLTLGIILLLSVNNIISFSLVIKIIIPVFLIIFGMYIILLASLKNAKSYVFSTKSFEIEENSEINTLFSTLHLKFNKLKGKENSINIHSIFSEVILYVPKGTRVIVEGSKVFSDVIDHREEKEENYTSTLYLKMNNLFSDIVIR